jgi:hypothetical protein
MRQEAMAQDLMKFRFKAFGFHILGSVCLIALCLGVLYAGWYRWPGWYLAGALTIALMMAGIDVVLGPLLTLIIANPNKPRRELARDISIIVLVQLIAAGYGVFTLWNGRPLYYTYSEGYLEMVQAADLNPEQVELGRKLNPALAPHWYSLPRWIFVPLPKDSQLAEKIMASSITGGDDVIQMPRYYQPWEAGLTELRTTLQPVEKMKGLNKHDKQVAAERLKEFGVTVDQPVTLPMSGRGRPIIAIFDPATGTIRGWVRVD